jgi:hypothetical protein
MTYKKKLIEVVLPLEAINIASAGGDLRADGRRSVGASGPVPHREKCEILIAKLRKYSKNQAVISRLVSRPTC